MFRMQRTLTIRMRAGIRSLPIGEIVYMEKQDHRIRVHTPGEDIWYYGTLSEAEEELDVRFAHFHRSYIINMDRIRLLSEGRVLLNDGSCLEVGEHCYLRLKEEYEDYLAWKRDWMQSLDRRRGFIR